MVFSGMFSDGGKVTEKEENGAYEWLPSMQWLIAAAVVVGLLVVLLASFAIGMEIGTFDLIPKNRSQSADSFSLGREYETDGMAV